MRGVTARQGQKAAIRLLEKIAADIGPYQETADPITRSYWYAALSGSSNAQSRQIQEKMLNEVTIL